MFKEACRGHGIRHRLQGEGTGKEAEAAACNWFMSELLPTYKDALDNIAAGRLSSVKISESGKVAPTYVFCTAFWQDLWLSAPGSIRISECCRQGKNNLQDISVLQAICAGSHHMVCMPSRLDMNLLGLRWCMHRMPDSLDCCRQLGPYSGG